MIYPISLFFTLLKKSSRFLTPVVEACNISSEITYPEVKPQSSINLYRIMYLVAYWFITVNMGLFVFAWALSRAIDWFQPDAGEVNRRKYINQHYRIKVYKTCDRFQKLFWWGSEYFHRDPVPFVGQGFANMGLRRPTIRHPANTRLRAGDGPTKRKTIKTQKLYDRMDHQVPITICD